MVKTAAQTQKGMERVILPPRLMRISYAFPLRGDRAREVHSETSERARQYKDSPFFSSDRHWEYHKEAGEIRGSNLGYLIIANEVLAKTGSRTLTFDEGMELDKGKGLDNGVYQDFGIAVYSEGEPNSEVARDLVNEAERRGWKLPVLAHPASLTLDRKGINVLFGDDVSLVLSGEQAREALNLFGLVGGSGVQRLIHGRDGAWYANGDGLAGSSANGRVGWVRAEGTRADFEADTLAEVEKQYTAQVEKDMADLERRRAEAINVLRGKE